MKNHRQKTNSKEVKSNLVNDFLAQKIEDPELQDIISDVISYSSEYEIYVDLENVMDWDL